MTPLSFEVLRLGTVVSTQDELRRRVREGEVVLGLCLRAEAQTGGRGRRGALWTSPPGGSYQSVGIGRGYRPWLTLALGVGIAGALGRLPGGPQVLVKWPNDLFLGGSKLGGILTEVVAGQVLVGVGVNVSNPPLPGAARLEGQSVDVVSDAVLEGIAEGFELALAGGETVAAAFAWFDLLSGREVEVVVQSETQALEDVVRGTGRGIDATGALLLEDLTTGTVREVGIGHVTRFGPRARRDRA